MSEHGNFCAAGCCESCNWTQFGFGASASNFNSPNGAHPLFSSFVVDDDYDLGKSEASPLR